MKKKTISIAMATMMVGSMGLTAVGCKKGPSVANDEKTVEVRVVSLGYGHKWAEELEKGFETKNPDLDVVIVPTTDQDMDGNILTSGPEANTADLMLGTVPYFKQVERGSSAVSGYDYVLEDLTDLLDETTYPDGTTLRERFLPGYLDWMSQEVEIDGEWQSREFRIPYATGLIGICYNVGLFEKHDWTIPNTTDELWALCDDITSKGYIAFSNAIASTYLNYFSYTMMGQYMGKDEYKAYFSPTSEDDYYRYTSQVDGYARLYALEESNKLQNPTWGRLTKYATEDTYDHAQARLMTDEAVLAINGDWFDNEMRIITEQAQAAGKYTKGTGFMAIPVTSAIVDKLSFWNTLVNTDEMVPTYYDASLRRQAGEYVGAMDAADELLSKTIAYIDAGKTGTLPSVVYAGKTFTVTADDVAIVEEARKTACVNGTGCAAVIPAYANAKEGAKKFLAYMYSNEGAEIAATYFCGAMLPVKSDYTKFAGYAQMSSFQKSVYQVAQNLNAVPNILNFYDYKLRLPAPYALENFHVYKITDDKYVSPYSVFVRDSLTKDQFIDLLYAAGMI